MATDEQTRFAPEPFKGKGMVDLEKKAYDYADSLKPIRIDEVIMGNVVGAGQGQNVARQAMIKAGIPKETNAFTVNKVCASGMKAVALAAQSDQSRGGGNCPRRRDGEHEPHPLCSAGGTVGCEDEQRGPCGSHGF